MKTRSEKLKHAIAVLEIKREEEWQSVKCQFHSTYESLKPFNVIKSTIHDITSSPDLKDNLLSNVIGLTTGYLSRKVVVGSSGNPLKKLFGTFLQITVTNFIAKNSDKIKYAGGNILRNLIKYRNDHRTSDNHNAHREYNYNED